MVRRYGGEVAAVPVEGADGEGVSLDVLVLAVAPLDVGCPPTGTATTSPLAIPQGISRVKWVLCSLPMVRRRA